MNTSENRQGHVEMFAKNTLYIELECDNTLFKQWTKYTDIKKEKWITC